MVTTQMIYDVQRPGAGYLPATTAAQFCATLAQDKPNGADCVRIDVPEADTLQAWLLDDVFGAHLSTGDAPALQAHARHVASRLAAKGETLESTRAVITKGQRLDRLASLMRGFTPSVCFGTGLALAEGVPGVLRAAQSLAASPLAKAAASGGTTALVAHACGGFGRAAQREAFADLHWLLASAEELVPAMQPAKAATTPTPARAAAELALSYQSFTMKALLNAAVTPTAKALAPSLARLSNALFNTVGSPIAGAATAVTAHVIEEHRHRRGPAYLFGCADWEARFDALKALSASDCLRHAGQRMARFPRGLATGLLTDARELLTATQIVKGGALVGGFASVEAARAATATQLAGHAPAAVEAARHAVNVVGSAAVFASWAGAGPLTDAATRNAEDFLRRRGRWAPAVRPASAVKAMQEA